MERGKESGSEIRNESAAVLQVHFLNMHEMAHTLCPIFIGFYLKFCQFKTDFPLK